MGMRLGVVKQSFLGPPGQYGRRVTRANWNLGTGKQCQNILENKGTKTNSNNCRDQKAGNKLSLKVIWGKREHNQIYKGNKDFTPLLEGSQQLKLIF